MKFTFASAAALCLGAAALAVPAVVMAEDAKDSWDGLVEVDAKKFDKVYLLPEADFSGYTKIMLDPTEVAFRRNWQRDHNHSPSRVSDEQAREILEAARTGFEQIVREAFEKEGYQVVTQPGADVLRVGAAIANLDVAAPETTSAVRSRTYSREAGSATLVVEVRDSHSGQLLGRTIDEGTAGEFGPYVRTEVTNRADFEQMFKRWATAFAKGLTRLRTAPAAS